MKQQESSLPLLPRLDRLDFLLQVLEEKHGLSGRHDWEDEYCSLSSAMEEVHHKGTLIQRLSALENRVLQLSSKMDELNTSKSRYDNDEKANLKQKQLEEETMTASLSTAGRTDKVVGNAKLRRKSDRKWLACLRLGCN